MPYEISRRVLFEIAQIRIVIAQISKINTTYFPLHELLIAYTVDLFQLQHFAETKFALTYGSKVNIPAKQNLTALIKLEHLTIKIFAQDRSLFGVKKL